MLVLLFLLLSTLSESPWSLLANSFSLHPQNLENKFKQLVKLNVCKCYLRAMFYESSSTCGRLSNSCLCCYVIIKIVACKGPVVRTIHFNSLLYVTLTRWVIASLKNTRSKCAPLTVSLYMTMYCASFSFRKSSVGTCKKTERRQSIQVTVEGHETVKRAQWKVHSPSRRS